MKNPILNEIKNLVADRDITLTKLAEKMGERLGRKYSLASLSQKLRNGTISYREIMLIAEILNYKIIFYDLNEKKFKINSWLLLFVKWPTSKHFFTSHSTAKTYITLARIRWYSDNSLRACLGLLGLA